MLTRASVYRRGFFPRSEYLTCAAYEWLGMGKESGQEVRRPELVCSPPLGTCIFPLKGERLELVFAFYKLYKPKKSI